MHSNPKRLTLGHSADVFLTLLIYGPLTAKELIMRLPSVGRTHVATGLSYILSRTPGFEQIYHTHGILKFQVTGVPDLTAVTDRAKSQRQMAQSIGVCLASVVDASRRPGQRVLDNLSELAE
jgi:hypothetical protein